MAILGVLVGGMVIAMYLPIFKLGSSRRITPPVPSAAHRAHAHRFAHAERPGRAYYAPAVRGLGVRARSGHRQLSQRRHLSSADHAGARVARAGRGTLARRRHRRRSATPRTRTRAPPRPSASAWCTPALRLPRLQGPDQGLAEHPGDQLAGPARALRRLPHEDLRCDIPSWSSPPASSRHGWPGTSASAPPRPAPWPSPGRLIALTGIDIDHQLLPDSITLPLLWAGLLAAAVRPRRSLALRGPCACRRASADEMPSSAPPRDI